MIKRKLSVVKGNITTFEVDAIVNAANSTLLGGGGVDGAIHRAAGPKLLQACKTLGGCPTGQSKLTSAYDLPAQYIIHTVGPIWRGGARGEPKLLASCYTSALKLALEKDLKTIAFPAISCGVYGYPINQAAIIAVTETAHFIQLNNQFENIYFVCFDDSTFEAYQQALDALHDD